MDNIFIRDRMREGKFPQESLDKDLFKLFQFHVSRIAGFFLEDYPDCDKKFNEDLQRSYPIFRERVFTPNNFYYKGHKEVESIVTPHAKNSFFRKKPVRIPDEFYNKNLEMIGFAEEDKQTPLNKKSIQPEDFPAHPLIKGDEENNQNLGILDEVDSVEMACLPLKKARRLSDDFNKEPSEPVLKRRNSGAGRRLSGSFLENKNRPLNAGAVISIPPHTYTPAPILTLQNNLDKNKDDLNLNPYIARLPPAKKIKYWIYSGWPTGIITWAIRDALECCKKSPDIAVLTVDGTEAFIVEKTQYLVDREQFVLSGSIVSRIGITLKPGRYGSLYSGYNGVESQAFFTQVEITVNLNNFADMRFIYKNIEIRNISPYRNMLRKQSCLNELGKRLKQQSLLNLSKNLILFVTKLEGKASGKKGTYYKRMHIYIKQHLDKNQPLDLPQVTFILSSAILFTTFVQSSFFADKLTAHKSDFPTIHDQLIAIRIPTSFTYLVEDEKIKKILSAIFNDLNAYECRACFAYEWDYINTIKDQIQKGSWLRKDINTFIKFFVFCNFIYALEQKVFLAHCNPEMQKLWARREWERPRERYERSRRNINPHSIQFSERHLKNFIIEKLVEKIPKILCNPNFVGNDKDISIINWSIQLTAQLTTDPLLHDKHYEILDTYLFKK